MALVGAVHSVGESLVNHLTGAHAILRAAESAVAEDDRTVPECKFEQLSGAQLNTNFTPGENLMTLHLFRVGQDRNMHTASDPRFPGDPRARPLSLELHYLLTAWAADARDEHTLMAWTMLELEKAGFLDAALLRPRRHWQAEETVQLQLSEMGHEDMMRIWEALQPDYRLSVTYIARPVRIETGRQRASTPVIATRLELTEMPDEEREDA